jgi:heme-degrading monooxygenase HmoA
MWAQMITWSLKPGKEQDLPKLFEQMRVTEQPGSGLVRSLFMRDQKDPSRVYTLVLFESEEKARARESDERRQEALTAARAMMAEIFDGPPQFVDLAVVDEFQTQGYTTLNITGSTYHIPGIKGTGAILTQ